MKAKSWFQASFEIKVEGLSGILHSITSLPNFLIFKFTTPEVYHSVYLPDFPARRKCV